MQMITELFQGLTIRIENPYLMSALNAFVMCAALPAIGFVVYMITEYLIGGILALVTRSERPYYVFYTYVTSPGVVYHELSHAIAVILTGARLEHVTFFGQEGDTLGHVDFSTRGGIILQCIQNSITACAPVITGLGAIYASIWFYTAYQPPIWMLIIVGYLLICIVMHMDMSSYDLISYVRGIPLFFIVFFLYSMWIISHMA